MRTYTGSGRSGVSLALALMVAGCGGATDGDAAALPLCSGDFEACGGDIVGRWESEDFCMTESSSAIDGCPGSAITAKSYSATETIEVRDDGTTTSVGKGRSTLSVVVPLDCLNGATCSDLEARYNATEGITQFSGTCSESNGSCHCDAAATVDGTEEDTYVVEGSRLTVTGADGDVDEHTFCQRGDQLVVEGSSSRTTYRRK